MTKYRVGKVERKASVAELRAKAKAKVAAKVAKAKAKVGRACKNCAESVAVLLAASVLMLAGCLAPDAPSRSQTITFDHSTVNIYGCGDATRTNEVARVELATQAMAIETGGNETQTQTPTMDISPKTDLSYGGGAAGAVKSVANAVECVGGNCSE